MTICLAASTDRRGRAARWVRRTAPSNAARVLRLLAQEHLSGRGEVDPTAGALCRSPARRPAV